MSFSLLLHEIEHPPTRQMLEELSLKVPGIAKADCAGFLEHWCGIVASNLELQDAQAFQAALRGAGYETDIVLDRDVPALHSDYRCQRIALTDQWILLSDAMGRSRNKPRNELVFAAAGVVEKQKLMTKFKLEIETREMGRSRYDALAEKRYKQEVDKIFFRIDLFFSTEPHRISLEIDHESVLFYATRPIRLKDTLNLKILMTDLHALLPPDRTNTSVRERSMDHTYSSMNAYEEEIRWAFYRLGAKA
ncbi:MAG: hypothetical protein V4727_11165 [Verrucomicrobiota bacterium]